MKKGLTSNTLKIIAIITMVIDHIGYYMYPALNAEIYYLFRTIGRISMPIFAYLIVQGFFYTKNINKYIFRIFVLAMITQISITLLSLINIKYFMDYTIGISKHINILYSYALSLILLAFIDRKKFFQNLSASKNLILKISVFILITLSYLIFNFDYGMRIPFIMITLYFIEKLFQKDNNILIKNNSTIQTIEKIKYLLLILISFTLSLTFEKNSPICKYSMLTSLLFIALCNGKKGKNSKFLQYLFYAFFPVHHILLYLFAMFIF